MSSTGEIGLRDAKAALESVAVEVAERLDRARRLGGVVDRKRADGNPVAARSQAAAARRLLDQAAGLLAERDAHRQRLEAHVESNPPIEDGIYHGHVRTFDRLRGDVDELARRVELELAAAQHRRDLRTPDADRTRSWEQPFDVVRSALRLLGHVRRHDVPALVRAAEHRDGAEGLEHPTDGLRARLAAIRERAAEIDSTDHDAIARHAGAINGELAADYRGMVDRFRDEYAALADDLATIASMVGGTADGVGAEAASPDDTGRPIHRPRRGDW